MVFDRQRPSNPCNTILSLGLGHINTTNHHTYDDHDHNRNHNHNHVLLPSLSLALPSDRETLDTMDPDSSTSNLIAHRLQKRRYQKEDSSGSASGVALSSSRSSVKREVSGDQEEVEEERVDYSVKNGYSYNIGHDQEQDEEGPRKKLRLTKEQSFVLEESFKEHSTLNPKQKQSLASKLCLRPRQVEVWFQNRRARTKLKQTEMDFEILKKCCETLKDENKRLHKEMQELKAIKVPLPAAPAPFYMQFPAATLSMCPSCESLSSGAGGSGDQINPSRISLSRSAKSARFYNPFAKHPSAAC